MTDPAERIMRFLYAIRSRGVTDARVLGAMEAIDRGAFVKGIFADRAYEDMPLPIACGQTISQPSVVGLMTQALQVGPRDKVLEIGTGSGYQAAILSKLVRRVYTVDRHRSLVREASEVFKALDLTNIIALTADGSFGLPDQAAGTRQDKFTNLLRRNHQPILAAHVIADQDRIQITACCFEKDLIGLQIEGYNPFIDRPVHLGTGHQGHEGIFHPESGAGVLEMRRPDHTQYSGVSRRLLNQPLAFFPGNMAGWIRPGKPGDHLRVLHVLEKARHCQGPVKITAGRMLGKTQRSVNGMAGFRLIGHLDRINIVLQFFFERTERIDLEIPQKPRHSRLRGQSQPAGVVVDAFPGNCPVKSFFSIHVHRLLFTMRTGCSICTINASGDFRLFFDPICCEADCQFFQPGGRCCQLAVDEYHQPFSHVVA